MEPDLFCGVFSCGAEAPPDTGSFFSSADDQVGIDPNPEWEPDDRREICARCCAAFGVWRRRHHCRGCGVLLCNSCCAWTELPEAFGYGQELQRVCKWCIQVKFNLLQAARVGQAHRVRVLMSWGIDMSEAAASGSTALHAAAGDRSPQGVGAVRCLTEQGFPEDLQDPNGWQPIHVAGSVGNIDVIRILVHARANLDDTTREEERTALHLATAEGHTHTAQYLVNTGAAVDLGDGEGNTPLLLAVRQGLVPLVIFLVHNGASPHTQNALGQDAFALNELCSSGRTYESSTPKLAASGARRAPTMLQAIADALQPKKRSNLGPFARSPSSNSPTGTMMGRASRQCAPGDRHVQLGTPGGTFRESLYYDPESATDCLHLPHYPDSSPPPELSTPSSLSSYELLRSSQSSREQVLAEHPGSPGSLTAGIESPSVLVMRWRMKHQSDTLPRSRPLDAHPPQARFAEQAEFGSLSSAEVMHDRRSELSLGTPGVTV